MTGRRAPTFLVAVHLAAALGVTLDRFARAWMETRRRREEREDAREATTAAMQAFGKQT